MTLRDELRQTAAEVMATRHAMLHYPGETCDPEAAEDLMRAWAALQRAAIALEP
jgi:hypothetical protein